MKKFSKLTKSGMLSAGAAISLSSFNVSAQPLNYEGFGEQVIENKELSNKEKKELIKRDISAKLNFAAFTNRDIEIQRV